MIDEIFPGGFPGWLIGSNTHKPSSTSISYPVITYGVSNQWNTMSGFGFYPPLPDEIKYLDNQFYSKSGKLLTEITVKEAINYINQQVKANPEVVAMARLLE